MSPTLLFYAYLVVALIYAGFGLFLYQGWLRFFLFLCSAFFLSLLLDTVGLPPIWFVPGGLLAVPGLLLLGWLWDAFGGWRAYGKTRRPLSGDP